MPAKEIERFFARTPDGALHTVLRMQNVAKGRTQLDGHTPEVGEMPYLVTTAGDRINLVDDGRMVLVASGQVLTRA
jgi:hypothetical protein